MRETQFISQNEDNWREFEEELGKKEKDPDKLSRLFTEITDDLSYSRSFYTNRSVRYYLNGLAQQIFLGIYKNNKKKKKAFLTFWVEELPSIIYQSRFDFLISFILFALSVAIGVFCAAENPDFVNKILGDRYVEMTLKNIESGDPLAVYKDTEELQMSLQITFNNLVVAFRTFILGIFLGIGTLASMLYNGIMIGCFHYFLFDHGIVKETLLTVWQHGTLEISAIIIAGASGITVGRGWFFPGTYTRLQAFKYSAIRGMKIFIGIAPIIIMAGFIEGFITRHTELPDVVRIMVIVLSLVIILGYYILIPFMTPKEIKNKYILEGINEQPDNFTFESKKVLNPGEVFTASFQVFKKVSLQLLAPITLISIVYGIATFVLGPHLGIDYNELSVQKDYSAYSSFLPSLLVGGILNLVESMRAFFNYEDMPALLLFNSLVFIALIHFAYKYILNHFIQEKIISEDKNYTTKHLLYIVGITIVAQAIPFLTGSYSDLVFIVLMPLLLLTLPNTILSDKPFFDSIKETFVQTVKLPGKVVGLYFTMLLFCGFSYLLVSSPISFGIMEFFSWNLAFEYELKNRLFKTGVLVASVFGIGITFSFLITGFTILYFSLIEIRTAAGLKSKVQNIGLTSKINGIVREKHA